MAVFRFVSWSSPAAGNAGRWAAQAMIDTMTKKFIVIILSLFVVSCNTVATVQSHLVEETKSTHTIFPSSTPPPTITATSTPLVTSIPTTSAEATIAAFTSLCSGAKEILDSEISPNGKWIAATCYWENGKEESPLQVVSIDGSEDWKIYYRDYAKGHTGDRHDGIMPYRWSNDGKFLYTVAGSRLSGCCWIGGKYILLIRLNLETGEQTEIINGTDFGADLPFSFTISENDRFLLFTPLTRQPYDFTVLDFQTQEARVVNLKESKPIDLQFAVMSPYEEVIVLPLFKNLEYNDYVVEALALIDPNSNEQRILVSDLKEGEELYPIRWIDKEHVLVSNAKPGAPHYFYESPIVDWSLNIKTGERKTVELP
jgi:hypothetical protein